VNAPEQPVLAKGKGCYVGEPIAVVLARDRYVARVEGLGVITNKPPTGAYRGARGPESAFCMERTIDLIAKELNLDPAEVQPKNFIPPKAFPHQTPTGLTYDSGNSAKALDRALELADYTGWRTRARRRQHPHEPLIRL
jgi:aerobic carbon-monoxide dehydrogenase large subunit